MRTAVILLLTIVSVSIANGGEVEDALGLSIEFSGDNLESWSVLMPQTMTDYQFKLSSSSFSLNPQNFKEDRQATRDFLIAVIVCADMQRLGMSTCEIAVGLIPEKYKTEIEK